MSRKARSKLLITKEKDSLAGMQSSELSVELFFSKSDLALTARNRPLGLSSIVELSQAQYQQTDAVIGNTNVQCQYRLALAMHNYRIGTARRDSSRLAQTERLSQGISPTRGQDAVNGVSGFSGVDSLACGAGRLLAQGRQGARSGVGKGSCSRGKHRALPRIWADQVHLESDDRRGVAGTGSHWFASVLPRLSITRKVTPVMLLLASFARVNSILYPAGILTWQR